MIVRLRCLLLLVILSLPLLSVRAQTLPHCTERPHWTFDIRARPELYCVEIVWEEPEAGEMAFTGLAFAPDGRLFAARPLHGQVLMLRDTDGDTQPDSPQVIAEGLDRPNALAYHEDALYIAGGTAVYRLPDGGDIELLTDDLPTPTGLWNGGLAVDGVWVYIGTGAACDTCDANPQQGTVVRVPVEGGDVEVYATGFRQPLGLLWHEDTLWATDSTRPSTENLPPNLDELNHVTQGADYGYPGCLGLARVSDADLNPSRTCEETTAPTLGLPSLSQPSAITLYTGEAFPHLQGTALMTLMGSTNRSDLRGYGLVAFTFPPPDENFPIEILIPYDASITSAIPSMHRAAGVDDAFVDMTYLNRRGVGLWPHHPYGVAVSPEGWIYLSVGGGRILSLRPR